MTAVPLSDPAQSHATAQGLRLQGVWHLVHWEITYSDDRPTTHPFGPDATGLIQYTADGGMAANIARARRPHLSGESARSVPEAERLAAFESYFSYAGRYHTRWHAGRLQVVHQVTHALNPNFVGTEQVRDVTLSDDGTLTLSASDPLPGHPGILRHHRLLWRR
jgi:hypothetical protein